MIRMRKYIGNVDQNVQLILLCISEVAEIYAVESGTNSRCKVVNLGCGGKEGFLLRIRAVTGINVRKLLEWCPVYSRPYWLENTWSERAHFSC